MQEKQTSLLTNGVILSLLATLCCLLWGSAFPCVKIGYHLFAISSGDSASQILFAGCRFAGSGILTILFGSIRAKKFLRPHKEGSFRRILMLSLFQTVLQYVLFYLGLARTSGVKSSIIEGANVFVTILVACLIFRQEALTWQKILGCILGFSGVVLANFNHSLLTLQFSFWGEGLLFLSTVAYAFSSVLIKRFAKHDNPLMLSGYQFFFGGLFLIILGFSMGGTLTRITFPGILILLYLALLSAIAYSLWALLLKYNPVSKVAIWGSVTPIFGVILSVFSLQEEQQVVGLQIIIALLLVCFGIYVVNRAKQPATR